jgi:uncharacterized membrane protein YhaH (DUF805 family)
MIFINSLFKKKSTPVEKALYLLPAIVSFAYFVDIILFLLIGKMLFRTLIPLFPTIAKLIFIFCPIFIFQKYYSYYNKINSVCISLIYIILFWIYITLFNLNFGWRQIFSTFVIEITLLFQSYLFSKLYLENKFDFVKISNYISKNFNIFVSSSKKINNIYSHSKFKKISVFNCIKDLFVNFFDFKSNTTRFEWIVCFIFMIILIFFVMPTFFFSVFEFNSALEFLGYAVFFMTIPFLSISARRLNDSNQSLWWLLILFTPHILGTILMGIFLLFFEESFLIGLTQVMLSIEDYIGYLKIIFYCWVASLLYFFYLMIIKPGTR